MSLTDNGNGFTMPVQPMGGYGSNGGFGGWGNDGFFWLIVLFLFGFMGNGWGNGYGANGGGTTYIANDVQRGFDQAALTGGISDISSGMCNGFSGVQQSLCNGFAGVNATVANGFAQSEISNNARQMADMQQQFALQSQLASCCCENRLATAGLQNVIQTEACADRSAVSDALRDVIASNTANTQAILDKLCEQEIEALKTQNQNLQTQLNMANLAASQSAQTGQLLADNAAQTQYVVNRIAPYPQPAYIVSNPNLGVNSCGCGCGVA